MTPERGAGHYEVMGSGAMTPERGAGHYEVMGGGAGQWITK